MSAPTERGTVELSLREAVGIAVGLLTVCGLLTMWLVIPHRTTSLEEHYRDHEARIRAIETVRVDLAEMKTDIREIKRKLEGKPL